MNAKLLTRPYLCPVQTERWREKTALYLAYYATIQYYLQMKYYLQLTILSNTMQYYPILCNTQYYAIEYDTDYDYATEYAIE